MNWKQEQKHEIRLKVYWNELVYHCYRQYIVCCFNNLVTCNTDGIDRNLEVNVSKKVRIWMFPADGTAMYVCFRSMLASSDKEKLGLGGHETCLSQSTLGPKDGQVGSTSVMTP